jgi:hypothetical protein
MASQLMEALTERIPLVATTILVSLLVLFVQRILVNNPLSGIPHAGEKLGSVEKRRQAYLAGSKSIYKEGYAKAR